MARGCVAGRIRSAQCFSLFWGDFCFFQLGFFSSIWNWSKENEAVPADPAPDQSQRSHLVSVEWPKKSTGQWLLFQALYHHDRPVLLLPGQANAATWHCFGCLCQMGCSAVWAAMLNAISPGICCASFQPQSLCSHSEAAKCRLCECDRAIWVKSYIQSPCQRFLSENTLLIHQLEFRAKV